MKISHLIFAVTLIGLCLWNLHVKFPFDLLWLGVLIGTAVWILEGLLGLPTLRLTRPRA